MQHTTTGSTGSTHQQPTTKRKRMPNINSLDAGHNTHRLTIHYFIYLLIQDFTTKCLLELYLKKKKKTPLLEIRNVKLIKILH